ncbi:MAG: A24 family peptidase [Phenylobacterium sp.]|uniref:prepilin peptidase n=1 Tax=Phenylobacterium sp. TaxID=1871053 RepID=UPI00272F0F61|nr:A24 family peptidase [Phenylobacterium sp.]MDP2010289.1 A24 family peptidase [Phenylobacterium sp.]MDP3633479.1 A24 family peptidase [Phenylobacterium sp.]MDP3868651.1 A24 family peptidase [Phenylobacterium sp.]
MILDAHSLPDWGWMALAATLGAVAGSFIGLISLRLPVGRPVGAARSACDGCGRRLGVLDLVPILSFVALRGRCRSCGSSIARRYLLLEVGCALLAVWAGVVHPGPLALAGALLAWQLLLLCLLDAEHFWLPRVVTLPLVASGLAVSAASGTQAALHSLIGAGAGFLSLATIAALYRRLRGREGLGGGDAYMLAGAGAWVGWIGLPTTLLWASLAGLSLVASSLLAGRKVTADQRLPFGVFLAAGTWLTWLYGPLGGVRLP